MNWEDMKPTEWGQDDCRDVLREMNKLNHERKQNGATLEVMNGLTQGYISHIAELENAIITISEMINGVGVVEIDNNKLYAITRDAMRTFSEVRTDARGQ